MGFVMTTNEAILYLAMGFMVIIGIWLTALTYLVLKRHRDVTQHTDQSSEIVHEEIIEEDVSEPEPPAEAGSADTGPAEEETVEKEPVEDEKTEE
jgi:hypothetical protein